MRRGLLIFLALTAFAAIGPVAAADACVGEAKSPAKLSEQLARQAVLCLINERRAHSGLGALQANANLNNSAEGHAVAMAKHNSYRHGNAGRRIRHSGYLSGATVWTVGENLGWGPGRRGTPKRLVASWMKSPEHRRVLLGGFRDIGIGMTKGAPFAHFGHNAATYTADLGTRNERVRNFPNGDWSRLRPPALKDARLKIGCPHAVIR
jgi:uncharacterized protein YkwD